MATAARRQRRAVSRERKPLTPIERKKLRAGILRSIQPGDTLDAVAGRLHQPKARIVEGIGEDIKAVGAMLGERTIVPHILRRGAEAGFGWSAEFVDLARRVHFGYQRRPRPAHENGINKPTPHTTTTTVAPLEGTRLPTERREWLDNLLNV